MRPRTRLEQLRNAHRPVFAAHSCTGSLPLATAPMDAVLVPASPIQPAPTPRQRLRAHSQGENRERTSISPTSTGVYQQPQIYVLENRQRFVAERGRTAESSLVGLPRAAAFPAGLCR